MTTISVFFMKWPYYLEIEPMFNLKVCHYLNQGCTLKDIRIRAAHLIAYFDFSKKIIFSLTLVH